MKGHFYEGFASAEDWTANIIKKVRNGFNALLPFTQSEETFIRSVVNGTGIKPELLVTDAYLMDLIKIHPALLWAEMKLKS